MYVVGWQGYVLCVSVGGQFLWDYGVVIVGYWCVGYDVYVLVGVDVVGELFICVYFVDDLQVYLLVVGDVFVVQGIVIYG